MTDDKQKARHHQAAGIDKQDKLHFNNTKAQRKRLLHALELNKSKGLTTQLAREALDIMHPAGRIRELRQKGYVIHMDYVDCPTNSGRKHRMGRYVLISTPKGRA